MTAYDDLPYSCPFCTTGLNEDGFCDCDDDPCCVRCHRVQHVETIIRNGLAGWGA